MKKDKDKEFTYNVYPQLDGSMMFVVREINGETVYLEELLGVMAAYLHESCGEMGVSFASDTDNNENKKYQ